MGISAVNNFGDTRSGGLAGPMGLFVIVLLCIATVLLIRNMNKRLRRLPDSFEDAKPTQREAEIARLNADLEASGTGASPTDVDRQAPPGSRRTRSKPLLRSVTPVRRTATPAAFDLVGGGAINFAVGTDRIGLTYGVYGSYVKPCCVHQY
jgi:hypothetical protein